MNLKKIITIALLLVTTNLFADQLQLVTKIQADKAVLFMKQNKVSEVILWCSCCTGEPMRKVTITKFYSRFSGTTNEYEVILEGTDEQGNYVKEDIDLAYVFLRSGNEAKCLGQLLKFECDPCTLPFEWK